MIHQQAVKVALCIDAVQATNGATITSQNIDLLGFEQCSITVWSTTADAASNSPSVFKIQESDDTNSTNFADVTAFVGGGTGGFTIPNQRTATTQSPYARLNVNCQYRKRYLRVLVSPRTTQTYYAIADLSRGEQAPKDATTANVAVIVNG